MLNHMRDRSSPQFLALLAEKQQEVAATASHALQQQQQPLPQSQHSHQLSVSTAPSSLAMSAASSSSSSSSSSSTAVSGQRRSHSANSKASGWSVLFNLSRSQPGVRVDLRSYFVALDSCPLLRTALDADKLDSLDGVPVELPQGVFQNAAALHADLQVCLTCFAATLQHWCHFQLGIEYCIFFFVNRHWCQDSLFSHRAHRYSFSRIDGRSWSTRG